MENRNEDAMMRALRAIIHTEISERIDQITEAQNNFKIEDYESDINEMIRDFINYNLAVTVDC